MKPTILISHTNDCRVCQEEIFGPVVVIQKFKTLDEVIDLANASEYGLGGAVFTKNIDTALKVARSVRTGRMWVNTYNDLPAGAPLAATKIRDWPGNPQSPLGTLQSVEEHSHQPA